VRDSGALVEGHDHDRAVVFNCTGRKLMMIAAAAAALGGTSAGAGTIVSFLRRGVLGWHPRWPVACLGFR
jgi:hypothetical protein